MMRNVESNAFGNDGKYTHWLKNVMNLSAIATVPHTNTINTRSCPSSLQLLCIGSICVSRVEFGFNVICSL